VRSVQFKTQEIEFYYEGVGRISRSNKFVRRTDANQRIVFFYGTDGIICLLK